MSKSTKKRIRRRNEKREYFTKLEIDNQRANQIDSETRVKQYFESLEKESVNVQGIDTNVKYYCAYHKGWCMPRYVSEEEDFVVFYSNPGWIGNWYWMTSIENFKKHFKREVVGDVGERVTGIKYVDVRLGLDHPRIATNKTWR